MGEVQGRKKKSLLTKFLNSKQRNPGKLFICQLLKMYPMVNIVQIS